MKNAITRTEIEALRAFADANGRSWKSELNHLWQTGAYNNAVMGTADAGTLQRIRNQYGPTWLQNFRLAPAGHVIIKLTFAQFHTMKPVFENASMRPSTLLKITIEDAQELYRRAARELPTKTTAEYITREAILNKLVTP